MDPQDDRDLDQEGDRQTESSTAEHESHATTGGAAAAGAVTGGVVGLAGGPIGAVVGAVGGAIVGAAAERMMHSDDDAEREEMGLENDEDRNPMIEDRSRAEYGTTTGTTTPSGSAMDTGVYEPGSARGTERSAEPSGGDRLELREEELHARSRPVETGQVTIGKDVVEEQRTFEVPVTREEVYVERHPVDRRSSDQPISEGQRQVEVPVREEQVNVEKRPVVYEEVGVDKREVSETQQVSGTVRREEARIDREGDVDVRGGDR
ncbi:MAG: YsnF/AvaK domain-containing protein [Chloroflexota bacterium]|nr:YsnF/AvaK domain-containing protein [Chloroflexota bacterium]